MSLRQKYLWAGGSCWVQGHAYIQSLVVPGCLQFLKSLNCVNHLSIIFRMKFILGVQSSIAECFIVSFIDDL